MHDITGGDDTLVQAHESKPVILGAFWLRTCLAVWRESGHRRSSVCPYGGMERGSWLRPMARARGPPCRRVVEQLCPSADLKSGIDHWVLADAV